MQTEAGRPNAFSVFLALFLLSSCKEGGGQSGGNDDSMSREAARAILDKAVTESGTQDAPRREAMAKSRGTVVPRPDLGPCPVKVTVPVFATKSWDDKSVVVGNDLMKRGDSGMSVTVVGAVGTANGPKRSMLMEEMNPLGILPPNDDPKSVRFPEIKALSEPAGYTYDSTLIIDAEVPPAPAGESRYEPGVLTGRMYVWDYQKKSIVCAADVKARSSPEATVFTSPSAKEDNLAKALLNDLHNAGVRAGVEALVAAGPPLAADSDGGAPKGDAGAPKKDAGAALKGTR
jgi:hypothetical protein